MVHIHTPMRAGSEDAVSVVADGVDYIFDGIHGARGEHNVVRFHRVDGVEVCVEEGG